MWSLNSQQLRCPRGTEHWAQAVTQGPWAGFHLLPHPPTSLRIPDPGSRLSSALGRDSVLSCGYLLAGPASQGSAGTGGRLWGEGQGWEHWWLSPSLSLQGWVHSVEGCRGPGRVYMVETRGLTSWEVSPISVARPRAPNWEMGKVNLVFLSRWHREGWGCTCLGSSQAREVWGLRLQALLCHACPLPQLAPGTLPTTPFP